MERYQTTIPNTNNLFESLTNDQFECLINDAQLLQISQIRFIIEKFSLPIKDKKTNLINYLMLLRYETSLVAIYNEIQNIILANDSQFIDKFQVIAYDFRFKSPPDLTNNQSNPPFIFGPISIPIGKNSGSFQFQLKKSNGSVSDTSINISFLFLNGISHQFEFECEINGFPIEVSPDDPYPQPIDITDLILFNSEINKFEIKMIQSSQPMMICIREYTYNDIEDMMEKIVGKPVNINKEDFYVYSKKCSHSDSFSLANFISMSLATGEWNCPICSQIIDPFNLEIDRYFNICDDS